MTAQREDATQLGLDTLGSKGWELVSVVYDGKQYTAFVKRAETGLQKRVGKIADKMGVPLTDQTHNLK